MIHKSDQINEIAKALAAAQSEMKAAKKDAKNPFFKSDYATLESVSDACLHVLNKHGIAVTQTTAHFESSPSVSLETTLIHSSGQWIGSVYPVHPTKNDPQSLGSAMTYARRYSLAAIAGVVVSDDDGESAMDRQEATQKHRVAATNTADLKQTTTQVSTGPTKPSQAQLKRLFTLADAANWQEEDIRAYLKSMGMESTKELNYFQYEAMCKKIQDYPMLAQK